MERNEKTLTKTLLELMRQLGNVAGYKTNTQKSKAFVYVNNFIMRKNL